MAGRHHTYNGGKGNGGKFRTDARLAPILRDWIRIGSLAWSGHCSQGRGLVLATITEDHAEYRYWAGSPCDCHAHWVDEYDPEQEAIILVRRDRNDHEEIYRVKVSPGPREAWALDLPASGEGLPH